MLLFCALPLSGCARHTYQIPYVQEEPEPLPSPEPTPTLAPVRVPESFPTVEFTEVLSSGMDLIPLCFSGGGFYCSSDTSDRIFKVSPNGHIAALSAYSPVPPEPNTGKWKDYCCISRLEALKRKDDGTFVAIQRNTVSGNSIPSKKADVVPGKDYLEYFEKFYLRTLDKNGRDLLTREITATEAQAMLGDGSFPAGMAAEELGFTFADMGVTADSVVSGLWKLKNGKYRLLTESFDNSTRHYSYEIADVTVNASSEAPEYSFLMLSAGEAMTPRLEAEVAAYNRRCSGKAGIRLTDGEEADLYYLTLSEVRTMAANGELMNLYPLMKADPRLQPSGFMPNILSAAEVSGGLYCSCAGFRISTLIGAASAVGNRCSWNYDEFCEAWGALGRGTDALPLYMTRSDVYDSCYSMDRELMSSDDQARLEAFCLNFPEEYTCFPGYPEAVNASDMRVRSDRQLLMPAELCNFDDVIRLGYEFGEEIAYIGWPTLYGCGSTVTVTTLDPGKNLAISLSCTDLPAAWDFVSLFFTAQYQDEMSEKGRFFPSRRSSFIRGLNEAMMGEFAVDKKGELVFDENGERIFVSLGEMYLSDFTEVRYYPVSAQRAENFRMLAETVSKTAA